MVQKKAGDSILVAGGGSNVFRNSRLSATTVAFLFSSEVCSGVLSWLVVVPWFGMALVASSIPCSFLMAFLVILRIILCLLNKILICLNHPKVSLVCCFGFCFSASWNQKPWLLHDPLRTSNLMACGRAGVEDMELPALWIYTGHQSFSYHANAISSSIPFFLRGNTKLSLPFFSMLSEWKSKVGWQRGSALLKIFWVAI